MWSEGFSRWAFDGYPCPLQLLNSSHVGERDKALLRSIMVGGVWNGFLLGKVRGQAVSCRYCGAPDSDGHLFCECPYPPLFAIRENPEFPDLMRMYNGHWPRCLLCHKWLPMLSGVNGASPWAAGAADSASYLVEAALGSYTSKMIAEWGRSDDFDRVEVGLMAALSSIESQVFLLLVLVSLLTSLAIFGIIGVGVMLMLFVLRVIFRLVEVSFLFLGLLNLSKEPTCEGNFGFAVLQCDSSWC